MKVTVYIRARDERWLAEQGVDPAAWVREQIKLAVAVAKASETRKERA